MRTLAASLAFALATALVGCGKAATPGPTP